MNTAFVKAIEKNLRPPDTESEHMTFVHFNIGLRRNVILSAAKNLSESPFVSLRVTTLVCQSFVVQFSLLTQRRALFLPPAAFARVLRVVDCGTLRPVGRISLGL